MSARPDHDMQNVAVDGLIGIRSLRRVVIDGSLLCAPNNFDRITRPALRQLKAHKFLGTY